MLFLIIDSAHLAISQLLSTRFRTVLWKSLGLTIALLIGLWFAADAAVSMLLLPYLGGNSWLASILPWLLGAGLVVGLGFLIAPVTSIFGGLFIDDIAREVEQKHYPNDPPGQPLAMSQATWIALKFTALVISTNLLALLLLLIPGVNLIIFFVANGYLLGREYFQFAALRFLSLNDSEALRQQNAGTIFAAGLLIAGFLAIPLLNLLTPMFATALMVHLFKKVQRRGY